MPRERDEVRTPRICVALVGLHWGISIGEPIGSVSPPDSTAPETARGQTNISSKNARIAAPTSERQLSRHSVKLLSDRLYQRLD